MSIHLCDGIARALQQPVNVGLRSINRALRKQPPFEGVVLEPRKRTRRLAHLGLDCILIAISIGIRSGIGMGIGVVGTTALACL